MPKRLTKAANQSGYGTQSLTGTLHYHYRTKRNLMALKRKPSPSTGASTTPS